MPRPVRYEHANPGDLVHLDVKKLGRIPDSGAGEPWAKHPAGRTGEPLTRPDTPTFTPPSVTSLGSCIPRSSATRNRARQPSSGSAPTGLLSGTSVAAAVLGLATGEREHNLSDHHENTPLATASQQHWACWSRTILIHPPRRRRTRSPSICCVPPSKVHAINNIDPTGLVRTCEFHTGLATLAGAITGGAAFFAVGTAPTGIGGVSFGTIAAGAGPATAIFATQAAFACGLGL